MSQAAVITRLIRWPPIASAATLLAMVLSSCATLPSGGVVAVGGHDIAYSLAGRGGQPVLLQSGLGDGSAPWATVFSMLQATHPVLAYDRPGYGSSSGAAASRDPCSVAAEARALLAAAGLRPPYILVGHSLGGLYQYAYARLYPQDVAALVLLDPTHPDHWRALQQEAPMAAAAMQALRSTVFSAAARREFDDQAKCLDRLDSTQPLRMPVRLLVSTRRAPGEGADFRAMLERLRADWLRLTGAPALVVVPDAGHYLQRDAPAAVLREVESVSAQITGGKPAAP